MTFNMVHVLLETLRQTQAELKRLLVTAATPVHGHIHPEVPELAPKRHRRNPGEPVDMDEDDTFPFEDREHDHKPEAKPFYDG